MARKEADDVLAMVARVRQSQRNGVVSPHKSLLLLLALGLLDKNGSSAFPWSVAEVELADLIKRFAPPTRTGAAQRAAYPFTHLRTDGLWVLDRDVAMDSVRELNVRNITGRLAPSVESAFRANPALAHEAARMLVTSNFPEEVAADVLNAVGFDGAIVLGLESARPDANHTEVSRQRPSRSTYELADYVDIAVSGARPQFRSVLERQPVPSGRQVVFLPVETLLCLAASFVVNHRGFGGSTAHLAPEPVPSLSALFKRKPSSILAKMANLDDSRPNGAKWDAEAGAILREQSRLFTHIYRVLLWAARAEGIGRDRLPDFLALENGGEFQLLGQDELGPSEIDDLRVQIDEDDGRDSVTERIILTSVRARQHFFAVNVLRNCGDQCVFCGLKPSNFGAQRMLFAGHIKPWRDSTSRERLDLRNGLAACPAHDIAFDTGLITVDDGLRIHIADSLAAAMHTDPMAKHYYGQPPMFNTILLPSYARLPRPKYLDWHRQHVFIG